MNKSCRTCKFFTDSYGFKNGAFVGLYSSCDLKKNISIQCKKDNFNKYKKREV